jgi:transposase
MREEVMNKRIAEHAEMATVVRAGLDTSKRYVQVHGVNAAERPMLRKQLKREDVLAFFSNMPPCLIGLEACSSSHYWVRELGKLGHTVRMMAASFVSPYRKNRAGKNDANDAEAICEAVGRPNMRFVSVKTEEQQATLALHNVRHGLMEERTAVLNRLRGELAEFGLWFPTSPHQAKRGAALLLAQAECRLPPMLKSVVHDLLEHVRYLEERIDAYDRQIAEQLKHNETAQRIRALIGVGDLTTSAALVIIGDAKLFKNGRQLGAFLGLTPRQASTGGKAKLGKITKQGNTYLRTLLVQGARSALQSALKRAPDKQTRLGSWIVNLHARVGYHKTLVAIANKHARMIWAMLAKGEQYNQNAWQAYAVAA